ncbi:MAG: hybrid sensor histidine kinase/response regulator, partial [Zetaproteobacteria bacterium]
NNARDAVEDSPNPTITIGVDTFNPDSEFIEQHTYFKPQAYAHIYITDNGCGIPSEDIEHLFEPFFTTKEVGKGTGLGLAMVFGAIKRHQGYIEVESTHDKETTFHIYLPLHDSSEKKPSPQQQTVAGTTGNHELILLVDDDKQVLEMGKDILESLNYQVVVAKDGEEAIAIFQQQRGISLIIIDIVMPKLGGVEAVERIRQTCPDIPVIFVTGYDKNMDLSEKIKGESDPILNKPYQIAAMQRLIRQKLHP